MQQTAWPRLRPGLCFEHQGGNELMRSLIVLTALAALLVASHSSAQECLRPKWTECLQFPNGGRHTGMDSDGKAVEAAVPAGAEICVTLEWEIQAETYAEFGLKNGTPWPKRDWDVRVETFCFYKN
jgi:hypothetical protein